MKLAVATFMEEEPRFLDEEEQEKVLRFRLFYLQQNMKLRYLGFGARDDDGNVGETGTTGIQITSCETKISQASVTHRRMRRGG